MFSKMAKEFVRKKENNLQIFFTLLYFNNISFYINLNE